jgi:hypothetical protein
MGIEIVDYLQIPDRSLRSFSRPKVARNAARENALQAVARAGGYRDVAIRQEGRPASQGEHQCNFGTHHSSADDADPGELLGQDPLLLTVDRSRV